MFGWLFNGLISLITYPFFILGWYLLVYLPLSIIAFFNFIFDQIGINIIVNALFQRETFSFESLPIGFWIFAITSISMGFVVFVLRYIKFLLIRKRSADSEIIAMGKVGIGSFAFIFLFPIIFFALLITIQSTLFLINDYIRGDQNLISVMLRSASDKFTDEEIKLISENFSSPYYTTFSSMESGEAISLIITLSASSIVIAYILGISFISWFTASAQLFMNFLTMPVWAISSIWDDGSRLKSWTKNFLGQFAIIIVYQVSFNLFLIWISSTYKVADLIDLSQVKSQQIFRFLFRIAFIIGGGLAIASFTRQIASQFGQEGALEHQQRLASSTLKVGGVALAGASAAMINLGRNAKNANLDVGNLFSKKKKNPFNIVDNSLLPSSKSSGWRLPELLGIGSSVVAGSVLGYKGLKFGTKKFREYRAKKALNPNQKKGPAKLFFDKIGQLFRKNKKTNNNPNNSDEVAKLENKENKVDKINVKSVTQNSDKKDENKIENSNEKSSKVEEKLENNAKKDAEVEVNSENNTEKTELVDDNNIEKTEKSIENSITAASEKQNLAEKDASTTEFSKGEVQKPEEKSIIKVSEKQDLAEKDPSTTEFSADKTEKSEINSVVEPKKQGFWEWFWGKLPDDEEKPKRKTREKKVKSEEKTAKKVTKNAKKTITSDNEKPEKKVKKVKTIEEKEKKPRGRKKKTVENQADLVKKDEKTVNIDKKIELKDQDASLNLKKIEKNQENMKPDFEKQIEIKNKTDDTTPETTGKKDE